MTRVSENSKSTALNFSVNKAKKRLEDLQLKGSTLRSITRPSDDPISNVEVLKLSNQNKDLDQFARNANTAQLHLNATESSLEQITDLLGRAKEIAIAQSSDFYGDDIRKNVSAEVEQIRNLVVSIANKRLGKKYIFAGFSTETTPFNIEGKYFGDKGHVNLEITKDFFMPINLHGEEVFYGLDKTGYKVDYPLDELDNLKTLDESSSGSEVQEQKDQNFRDLASTAETGKEFKQRNNIFGQLTGLITALENGDSDLVQETLNGFDDSISRLVTLRTRVGSALKTIETTKETLEGDKIDNSARKSVLVDADVAELFSDLNKQQSILKTTYQAGQQSLNKTLLDFLR
jgi:flagellar hook-associated protein 3 FlgL